MKNAIAALALVALAGCASETPVGKCVGIIEERDPRLEYKLSVRNVVVGIVFFELIIPPVVVLSDQLYCPVRAKQ